MERGEFLTIIRNLPTAARHPPWWLAYARGGRSELLRSIVAESIASARSRSPVNDISELPSRGPSTPLGKLGAPQEYLYYLVRWLRPQLVVETGVYRGISTSFLLAALNDNEHGMLYSVDLPGATYRIGSVKEESRLRGEERTGFVVPKPLRERWKLSLGDSRVVLPHLLETFGSIDLFFHDSEHTYEAMTREFAAVHSYLRVGGVLASDDVDWNSAFGDFVRSHEFNPPVYVGRRLGLAVRSRSPDSSQQA